MRTTSYILLIILAPIASIAFYMYFHIQKFSENQIDWGAFGSFVGGVSAPIVAGITLVFLIQSGKSQSRQVAQKTALDLIDAHVNVAESFEYSGASSGEPSFLALWNNLLARGDVGSEPFNDELKSIEVYMERLVRSSLFIVDFVSDDVFLSAKDKRKILDLWVSRLKRSELKLFLVLSLRDDEISQTIIKNNLNITSSLTLRDNEQQVFNRITLAWTGS